MSLGTSRKGASVGAGLQRHGPWLATVGVLLMVFGVGVGYQSGRAQAQPIVAVSGGSGSLSQPYLRVNGIATIDLRPDVADVTITLSIERARPNAALRELRTQREGLVASLAELGISGENLRSSHTGVNTVYEPHGNRDIRGYEATQTFVASVCEFDRLGDVLERAAAFEIGSMRTSYRSTKMSEKKKELREMALRAAAMKAEQSASVLGVELGPVISIEETGRNGGGWGSVGNFVRNEYASEGPTGAPVEPGAVPMTLTVEVGYRLADA